MNDPKTIPFNFLSISSKWLSFGELTDGRALTLNCLSFCQSILEDNPKIAGVMIHFNWEDDPKKADHVYSLHRGSPEGTWI